MDSILIPREKQGRRVGIHGHVEDRMQTSGRTSLGSGVKQRADVQPTSSTDDLLLRTRVQVTEGRPTCLLCWTGAGKHGWPQPGLTN